MNSKSFSQFFFAVFLMIALTAVFRWIVLSRVPFSYMDGEYPYWTQQKDYVNTKSDKKETVFLGDSRMKAGIIPDEISEKAYNLAVGGGTSFEMFCTLKNYLKNHPKPEKVILGFAPSHFQYFSEFYSRTLYFHFLSPCEELVSFFVAKFTKDEKLNFKEYLKYDLIFPQKYSAACINSKFRREKTNRNEYEKCVVQKGHMWFGLNDFDDGLNQEANDNKFIPSKKCDFYLKKLVKLCENQKIPLFIEQLPMNPASFESINKSGYYFEYQNYLKKFDDKDKNVKVNAEIPCYEPEFFGDNSHLNKKGAERFSKEIKEKYF